MTPRARYALRLAAPITIMWRAPLPGAFAAHRVLWRSGLYRACCPALLTASFSM